MSSDTGGVAGKITDKVKAAVGGLMGDESQGDADPDIEYEPTPDQEVLHDGMVVLSKDQTEQAGSGDTSDAGNPADGTSADGTSA